MRAEMCGERCRPWASLGREKATAMPPRTCGDQRNRVRLRAETIRILSPREHSRSASANAGGRLPVAGSRAGGWPNEPLEGFADDRRRRRVASFVLAIRDVVAERLQAWDEAAAGVVDGHDR